MPLKLPVVRQTWWTFKWVFYDTRTVQKLYGTEETSIFIIIWLVCFYVTVFLVVSILIACFLMKQETKIKIRLPEMGDWRQSYKDTLFFYKWNNYSLHSWSYLNFGIIKTLPIYCSWSNFNNSIGIH